jgi:hypothetical protein
MDDGRYRVCGRLGTTPADEQKLAVQLEIVYSGTHHSDWMPVNPKLIAFFMAHPLEKWWPRFAGDATLDDVERVSKRIMDRAGRCPWPITEDLARGLARVMTEVVVAIREQVWAGEDAEDGDFGFDDTALSWGGIRIGIKTDQIDGMITIPLIEQPAYDFDVKTGDTLGGLMVAAKEAEALLRKALGPVR